MARNKSFRHPERQSIQPDFALHHQTITGPLGFFNPTRARYGFKGTEEADVGAQDDDSRKSNAGSGAQVQWNTRDNRKGKQSIISSILPCPNHISGRHTLVISHSSPLASTIRSSTDAQAVLHGIGRMFTVFPYWDISWLIAVFFTVGCLVFIACGLFYWLPIAYPRTQFTNEGTIAGGVTAFIGATLFQIGAVLLLFEACNENATGCFGWALKSVFTGKEGDGTEKVVQNHPEQCQHHHQNGMSDYMHTNPQRSWKWWPTWKELTTHYIYEIGFLASASMSIGATIFYITGILALPGVYDKLSPGVLDGVYWLAYLVGGIIFIISSVLYVLETQTRWYLPAPKVLGWHIGVWNLIGSIGWTLSAALGYCSADWCGYQSDLTLIWASMAFTIGSAILWYESLNKYPVVIEKS